MRNKTDYSLSQRILAFVLAIAMFLLGAGLDKLIGYADEPIGGLDYVPKIKVSFENHQSGEKLTQFTNSEELESSTWLIRNGSNFYVDLQMEALYTEGEAMEPIMMVQLPYFYYDDEGRMCMSYDDSKGYDMGIEARVTSWGSFAYFNDGLSSTSDEENDDIVISEHEQDNSLIKKIDLENIDLSNNITTETEDKELEIENSDYEEEIEIQTLEKEDKTEEVSEEIDENEEEKIEEVSEEINENENEEEKIEEEKTDDIENNEDNKITNDTNSNDIDNKDSNINKNQNNKINTASVSGATKTWYRGNELMAKIKAGGSLKPGVPQTIQVELRFFGDVPENTRGTVNLGAKYADYYASNGNKYYFY